MKACFIISQYSAHFLDAHLAVISMLDLCREAGTVERVLDDGGYYESRDLEILWRILSHDLPPRIEALDDTGADDGSFSG